MPVNISQSPSSHSHLSDRIVWGATLSDLGTFPIRKEIAVQLLIDGIVASDIKRIRPSSTNEVVFFDFTDIISKYVDTVISFMDDSRGAVSASATSSGVFSAEVSLSYGESSYNSTNCLENSINLSESTNIVTVYNSNLSYLFRDNIDTSRYIFASRPKCISLPIDTHDSFFALGSSTITYTFYDYNDNIIVFNLSNGSGLHLIKMGTGNLPTGTAYFTTTVLINGVSTTYRTNIHEKEDSRVVYFLDPLGSYSPMLFEGNEVGYINRTSKTVNVQIPYVSPDLKKDGIQVYDQKAYEELSLTKKTYVMDGNKDYYNAFAKSSKFIIQNGLDRPSNLSSAQKNFIKFIVPSERIPFYLKRNVMELQLNGYFGTPLETHQNT